MALFWRLNNNFWEEEEPFKAFLQACSCAMHRLHTELEVSSLADSSANASQQLILEHAVWLSFRGVVNIPGMFHMDRPELVEMAVTMVQVAEQMPHSNSR